jgi:hypothetical protein
MAYPSHGTQQLAVKSQGSRAWRRVGLRRSAPTPQEIFQSDIFRPAAGITQVRIGE